MPKLPMKALAQAASSLVPVSPQPTKPEKRAPVVALWASSSAVSK